MNEDTKNEREIKKACKQFLIEQGRTPEYAEAVLKDEPLHQLPRVWCEGCINKDPRIREIIINNDNEKNQIEKEKEEQLRIIFKKN